VLEYVDTRAGLDTDSGSAAHNDGITSNYHQRLRHPADGMALQRQRHGVRQRRQRLRLEDGTYNAGQIQVWQTVGGIDSAHTSIGKTT
jgi:hypothetical protein